MTWKSQQRNRAPNCSQTSAAPAAEESGMQKGELPHPPRTYGWLQLLCCASLQLSMFSWLLFYVFCHKFYLIRHPNQPAMDFKLTLAQQRKISHYWLLGTLRIERLKWNLEELYSIAPSAGTGLGWHTGKVRLAASSNDTHVRNSSFLEEGQERNREFISFRWIARLLIPIEFHQKWI